MTIFTKGQKVTTYLHAAREDLVLGGETELGELKALASECQKRGWELRTVHFRLPVKAGRADICR